MFILLEYKHNNNILACQNQVVFLLYVLRIVRLN
jgi:hypothetical protein